MNLDQCTYYRDGIEEWDSNIVAVFLKTYFSNAMLYNQIFFTWKKTYMWT